QPATRRTGPMSGRSRRRRSPRRPQPPSGQGSAPETAAADASSSPAPDDPGTPAQPAKKRRRRRRRPASKDQEPQIQKPAQPAGKGTGSPSKAELARRATSTRKEVSAGGVVYRRTEAGALEILLAARRTLKGNIAWGLAKGHIEEGESPEGAAVREVREETGWDAVIEASLGLTKYFYVWENVRIRKTVHFFLMRAGEGAPGQRDDEMEEIRWFPLERALKRAAYRGERDILLRAAGLLG
ncbi:MAG: NUDIX hydrolase, partial [Actinomycetota bacterium]